MSYACVRSTSPVPSIQRAHRTAAAAAWRVRLHIGSMRACVRVRSAEWDCGCAPSGCSSQSGAGACGGSSRTQRRAAGPAHAAASATDRQMRTAAQCAAARVQRWAWIHVAPMPLALFPQLRSARRSARASQDLDVPHRIRTCLTLGPLLSYFCPDTPAQSRLYTCSKPVAPMSEGTREDARSHQHELCQAE